MPKRIDKRELKKEIRKQDNTNEQAEVEVLIENDYSRNHTHSLLNPQ